MGTVVQTNYAPEIRAAVAGMIADMAGYEIYTKLCETTAGIGFGLAVSQGTNDMGAIIGGSAYVGISVRDITIDGAPLAPTDESRVAVDIIPQRKNFPVLTRGRIWVLAQNNVAANDAVYYDTTTGRLGNSASGAAAQGSIVFTKNPVADETVVVDNTTITFKASGAAGPQCNIGPTLGDTLVNLKAALVANETDAKYDIFPAVPPGGGSGANTLLVSYGTVGTGGNAILLSTTASGATASGTTLAGGSASATAITGATWRTSAIAGELAIVSLGIQK